MNLCRSIPNRLPAGTPTMKRAVMADSIAPASIRWQFWIDRGGTFTDIVARRPDGCLLTHKLLSDNPEHYPDAALHGIRELLGIPADQPIPAASIAEVRERVSAQGEILVPFDPETARAPLVER